MDGWESLLDFSGITNQDIKEILNRDENGKWHDVIHSDHSDAARRAILRLYTLETPLYRTLNKANSCRDERAIPTLGPYARLLHMAVYKGTDDNLKKRKEITWKDSYGEDRLTLYRGLGLPEEAIKTYREFMEAKGNSKGFSFTSFMSTSTDKNIALEFAYMG